MARRAVSTLTFALSLSLAATLSGGSARADLAPPRPAPAAKPAAAKPAAAPAAKPGPSGEADPSAVPGDDEAPGDAPQLSERAKALLAIHWQNGPMSGSLGDVAEVAVPEGFVFADGDGTRKFLELNENPTNGRELGMVAAPDFSWVATFEFQDIGYVKDEEKAELNGDEILSSLREGNEEGNKARKAHGWTTVSLLGWAQPPKYDETTHNLEWATRVQDDTDKHVTVNHNIRLLGRGGVMEASLMTGPDDYAAALPAAKKMLDGYQFKTGQKYSEWRQGDKVAAIGLTGLITGGALAAAAKSGLLGKLGTVFAKGGKAIILGIAAAGAAIARALGLKKKEQE